MNNIHDEINDLKNQINHRSAFRIHTLLENNRVYFLKHLDEDFYNFIVKQFGLLADQSRLQNTPHFKEEYKKLYGMLSYRLDKIL